MAGWVKDRWKAGDIALSRERRDYWINYAFYEGQQWTYWHVNRNEVIEHPRPRDSDRVRMTVNRLQPNLVTLLARLTQRNLTFEVPPSAADSATLHGARLAEHILESARASQNWESTRSEAIYNCFLGGTAAVLVEWDSNARATLGVDDESGRTVHEGDVAIKALSIAEFTLQPGTRVWQDSPYVIVATAMPPGQARDHYGMDHTPDADASGTVGPLQRRLFDERGFPSNVRLSTVYSYYQKPLRAVNGAPSRPGRHTVVIGGEVVLDEAWPFPFDHLPIWIFRQQKMPKRWTGHTLVNDARPLQVGYNMGISCIAEHMKLAGNARLAIPDNSGVEADELTDTPGEHFYYDGQASHAPQWVQPAQVPRWLVQQTQQFKDDLDDIMFVRAISRGEAPGDRNSGLALSVLAEKDEAPMGPMSKDQAEGWGFVGTSYLEMCATKVTEFRTAQTNQGGIPLVQEWTGRRLKGQTRATVPLDVTLPHSRAAMQAWVTSIFQQFPNLMPQDPSVMARLLDMPNTDAFSELADADIAQAQRENLLMSIGQIPALDDRPFPVPWDDHAKHIAEHNRFRKSDAYIFSPSEYRSIVDMHIQAHEKMAAEQVIQQQQLEQAAPGMSALPQADEPPGSMVPADHAEQIASAQVAASGAGGAQPSPSPGGASGNPVPA